MKGKGGREGVLKRVTDKRGEEVGKGEEKYWKWEQIREGKKRKGNGGRTGV